MCEARQARTACLIVIADAFHPAGGASHPHPAVGTARSAVAGKGVETAARTGDGAVGSPAPPAPSGRTSNANTRTSARSGDGVAIFPARAARQRLMRRGASELFVSSLAGLVGRNKMNVRPTNFFPFARGAATSLSRSRFRNETDWFAVRNIPRANFRFGWDFPWRTALLDG